MFTKRVFQAFTKHSLPKHINFSCALKKLAMLVMKVFGHKVTHLSFFQTIVSSKSEKNLGRKYSKPTCFFGICITILLPLPWWACCEMSFCSTVTCSLRSRSKRASADGEGRIGVDNPSFSSCLLRGVISNKGMNGEFCHGNTDLLLAVGSTRFWLKRPRHLP